MDVKDRIGHANAVTAAWQRAATRRSCPLRQAALKEDWGNWRGRQWADACTAIALDPVPRPYDLRQSFASLLLAEGRTIHYVAAQLGHSPALTLSTYGHLFAEYADADRIDAEAEIAEARGEEPCSLSVPSRAS